MRSNEEPLKDFDVLYKIVLVGDSGVGKSSLFEKYRNRSGTCPSRHLPTIGVEFSAKIVVTEDAKRVKTQVWDTSGQERYRNITTAYYRGAEAIILMFDLTKHNSFENLKKWLQDVRGHVPKDTQIILVANKSDLVAECQVNIEEVKEFISKNNICHYFHISIRINPQADVERIFRITAEKVLQAQALSQVAAPVVLIVPKKEEKETDINEEAKLLSNNNKIIKCSDAPLNDKPTLKEVLVTRLKKYADRIDGYLNGEESDDVCYQQGFWFFKASRANNRMVNHELAKELLSDLKASDGSIDSVDQIFQDIDRRRMRIVDSVLLGSGESPFLASAGMAKEAEACKKSGINSTELNEVIEIAGYSLGR